MSNVDKIAKDLAGIIKSSDSKGTAPYDTQATVKRIENGIAWVQIPGGVDETPVQMTLTAKEGDTVQVRVSGGRAWITGNGTAPPTDDARANDAYKAADKAYSVAENAIMDAQRAHEAADSAEASAEQAQTSAENAGEYAARALGNLSTVQSVTETLNWITQHGTMTLTTDTVLDPTHVYFVRDNNGDYEVGNYHYSVVTEPKLEDISTYYVLSIDESLNNYVGTHLAVTSEGLWLLPDAGGNKVLIATGQGQAYTAAGTYIIKTENATDVVLANFTEGGTKIGKSGSSHIEMDFHSLKLKDSNGETYFDVYDLKDSSGYATIVGHFDGRPVLTYYPVYRVCDVVSASINGRPVGVTSYADHSVTLAERAQSGDDVVITYLTDDTDTKSYTFGRRAEGSKAGGMSVAEGCDVIASGAYSHAQNHGTIAKMEAQTAIGEYNIGMFENLLIIGNGTADNARSNALTVARDGDVELALDTTAASGTTDGDLYAAITALGWQSDVIV